MPLSLEDPDLAAGQGMVKFFCYEMAARRTFAAKQEQGRNMQAMKPERFENIVFNALQFTMNGMSRGDSPRPVRSCLQGRDFRGGRLDYVSKKEQQHFFLLSRTQQHLHGFGEIRRPAAAIQRNRGFIEDQSTDILCQGCGFQGAEPSEGMTQEMHCPAYGIDDRGNVFALASKRITRGIATVSPASPIESPHLKLAFKRTQHRLPGEVIARGAVYKQ
jgi:hypothetical protein